MGQTKPTLHDIRERHYFDYALLAERAGLDLSVLERVLRGQPVHRYQAELVLATLATFIGEAYTLQTVEIALLPQEDPA